MWLRSSVSAPARPSHRWRATTAGVMLAALLAGGMAQADDEPGFVEPKVIGQAVPVAAGSVQCDVSGNGNSAVCQPMANPGYQFDSYTADSGGCDYLAAHISAYCAQIADALHIPLLVINGGVNGSATDTVYVTAMFKIRISTAAEPAAGGSVNCSATAVSSGDSASCTAQPNPGWRFDAFTGDCSGAACTLDNITAPRSVTANFSFVGTHSITTTAQPPEAGGTLTCTPNPVTHGDSSTCTGSAALGWALDHFSGDCSGTTCHLTAVDADRHVTGHFAYVGTESIATQAMPADGGSIACTPNPATTGSASSCTATPHPGYAFAHFSGDCSGATCTLPAVTAGSSVTAHFSALPTYPVTITLDPVDAGNVSCTLNPVYENGATTCTAHAGPGYVFANFVCSGCLAGPGNTVSFPSVTTPVALLARFNPLPTHDIQALVSPAAAGSVTCTPNPIYTGGTSTCTASAAPGFRFAQFSGDCVGSGCMLTNVNAGKTVTAHFTRLSPPLNGTGQTRCHDGMGPAVCTQFSSGDGASHPRQDGRFGRDAQATAGTLTKAGGGHAGFDFTRIAVSGAPLGEGATPGSGAGDWGCTRDNVTGLTWEIKTTDGGPRDINARFTLAAAHAHAAQMNAAALCGHTNWRVPSRHELRSIVSVAHTQPAVDPDYFPNTALSSIDMAFYWTSDFHARHQATGNQYWMVAFRFGTPFRGGASLSSGIRLVRNEE